MPTKQSTNTEQVKCTVNDTHLLLNERKEKLIDRSARFLRSKIHDKGNEAIEQSHLSRNKQWTKAYKTQIVSLREGILQRLLDLFWSLDHRWLLCGRVVAIVKPRPQRRDSRSVYWITPLCLWFQSIGISPICQRKRRTRTWKQKQSTETMVWRGEMCPLSVIARLLVSWGTTNQIAINTSVSENSKSTGGENTMEVPVFSYG